MISNGSQKRHSMQDKKIHRRKLCTAGLNVASIAQIFGFNASYLSRLFKARQILILLIILMNAE